MHADVRGLVVAATATIRDAMTVIDRGALEIALLVDDRDALVGVVTDGDLRRALLGGATLDDPVLPHATGEPLTVPPTAARADVVDLMRARSIAQVPVVGADGRVVGVHTLREMIAVAELPNWAVVMAGGRGTRLGDLTRTTPKPMTTVAGRPILEWIVLNLLGSGIRRIFVSVNYLSDVVEAHFGDGTRLGCRIEYLREDPGRPLGTAGSLSLLPTLPRDPVLVMNGDLMTTFRVEDLLAAHGAAAADLTIGVREYTHEVPFGVVELDAGRRVLGVREKPVVSWPVSAGVYVLAPDVVAGVPADRELPMTELIDACLAGARRVVAWTLGGEWIDVGRPADLSRARGLS